MSTNFADVLKAEGVSSDLSVLKGNDSTLAAGSFVLSGQKLATDDGFRNVSKIWYDKTMSFDDGFVKLAEDKATTHDLTATPIEMVPAVTPKGDFAMFHKPTERFYIPTEHALNQIANWADTGTWTPRMLTQPITNVKGDVIGQRDRGDAETLARLLQNGFRRLDNKKTFFWRTREDGTLRAMLTDRYAVVDNRWYLEVLKEFIPGGRLSHWKGDGDTLYGNILIPDNIRMETDSEYGAMLSIGNSEIGVRRVSSLPSIFRAICMNGCIWGQTKGKGIKQVHRGKINLATLKLEIKQNLNEQIPLAYVGIDALLKTRIYACDGMDMKPVIGVFAKEHKLQKKQATQVLKAWEVEANLTPDLSKTLFGIINGFTRAAQEQTADKWVEFDEIGGKMVNYTKNDFDHFIGAAKRMKTEEVKELFA